jgi:hypothetical protein
MYPWVHELSTIMTMSELSTRLLHDRGEKELLAHPPGAQVTSRAPQYRGMPLRLTPTLLVTW